MTENTLYLIKAFFLGIVEGLTEFIPVSSTGHLILIGDWINFESSQGKVFEVVIQLGSILAVMWVFRAAAAADPWHAHRRAQRGRLHAQPADRLLPAAVIGGIFIKSIKQVFYHPGVVVVTLVLGGLIMLWVERKTRHAPGDAGRGRRHRLGRARHRAQPGADHLEAGAGRGRGAMPGHDPGHLRSGATIIGGMIAGIQRKTATEFSFFLAMPTMLRARRCTTCTRTSGC